MERNVTRCDIRTRHVTFGHGLQGFNYLSTYLFSVLLFLFICSFIFFKYCHIFFINLICMHVYFLWIMNCNTEIWN